jgi:hypothetical protein
MPNLFRGVCRLHTHVSIQAVHDCISPTFVSGVCQARCELWFWAARSCQRPRGLVGCCCFDLARLRLQHANAGAMQSVGRLSDVACCEPLHGCFPLGCGYRALATCPASSTCALRCARDIYGLVTPHVAAHGVSPRLRCQGPQAGDAYGCTRHLVQHASSPCTRCAVFSPAAQRPNHMVAPASWIRANQIQRICCGAWVAAICGWATLEAG